MPKGMIDGKSVRDILPNDWTVQEYGRDDPRVSITEIFPIMPPFRHEDDANRIGTSQGSSRDVSKKTEGIVVPSAIRRLPRLLSGASPCGPAHSVAAKL